MTAVEMINVTAGYGRVDILHDVSYVLGADEVVTILGPNGSGKSTFLKAVMGIVSSRKGTVRLQDKDVTGLKAHKRARLGLGYVPQTDNVFRDMTVWDNLRVSGAFTSKSTFVQESDYVFELFPKLADRRSVRAGHLSGGERRMLSIACSLIAKPEVLLLDEPSSDLAPKTVEQVFDQLREVRTKLRIPMLLVEQNVRHGRSIADRVCVLVAGTVAFDGANSKLDDARLTELFLGTSQVPSSSSDAADPARAEDSQEWKVS